MNVSFYTFDSAYDDLQISVVSVLPDAGPKAVVQLAHGMCGTKERLMPFMEYLAGEGIACFANDHRGHGTSVKSEKDLGYMYDGGRQALVADMKMLTDRIKARYPDIPIFLLGHSMGSMAARVYLRTYPDAVDGLIICGSPGYNPMAPVVCRLLSVLCRCGLGRMRTRMAQTLASQIYNRRFASEGPQAWVCSDPQVRMTFNDSPKHNYKFTVNASHALMGLMQETYSTQGWKNMCSELPILFLAGNDDPCAGGPSGIDRALAVLHEAGYRSISVKIYPAMRHEILNEIGKERVWRDILEFIGQ